MGEIRALLASCGLACEPGIQVFLTCRIQGRLVACAGLEANVVKCVAICKLLQGENLALALLQEMAYLALERGQGHLFLYTKPENREIFEGCGFHALVEVPGIACLMENTPVGASAYARRLEVFRRAGRRVGGIVLNANPFTLGHRHLVASAAGDCDVLHVFVVAEDASFFPYKDRLALVRQGLADLPNVKVHPGSVYMVSKATFPTYFIKEQGDVETGGTGLDLLLFRRFIAPALGITHRYVGSEPFCPVTRKYNEEMRHWLEGSHVEAPAIQVVELERHAVDGLVISASEVRRRLVRGDLEGLRPLVPRTTYDLLAAKYAPGAAVLA